MTATLETPAVTPVPVKRGSRPTETRVPGQRSAIGVLLAPFAALCLGVFVVPAAYAIYLSVFSTQHSGLGFGNGRTTRNLFEHAVSTQATRLAPVDHPSDEQLTVLVADDIPVPGEGPLTVVRPGGER